MPMLHYQSDPTSAIEPFETEIQICDHRTRTMCSERPAGRGEETKMAAGLLLGDVVAPFKKTAAIAGPAQTVRESEIDLVATAKLLKHPYGAMASEEDDSNSLGEMSQQIVRVAGKWVVLVVGVIENEIATATAIETETETGLVVDESNSP
jgi:hypothetical protein